MAPVLGAGVGTGVEAAVRVNVTLDWESHFE